MKISRILFPTDFSESSLRAAGYTADLALKYDASVRMLHVIYDIGQDTGWYGIQLDMDTIYDDVKKSAEAEMERTAEKIFKPLGIETEKALSVGKPSEEIIGAAREGDMDLIVLGSHGRRAIGRVLFGSTAQRVVRKAPCPVLIVREAGVQGAKNKSGSGDSGSGRKKR